MVGPISFSAITAAGKAIGSAVKLKDKGEILEEIIPLQETLNEAQRQATEALSQIHSLTIKNIELENKIQELEKADEWKSKYKLHSFSTGNHAWALKDNETGDYNFICPTCFDKGQKSGLQETQRSLNCPVCSLLIQKYSVNIR